MTLDPQTYLEHIGAYVNNHYVMHDGVGGEVILQEKYHSDTGTSRPKKRNVRLLLPGPGLAFKLDAELGKCGASLPLFHFLNDNAKPWSKRCDFVIFM